MAYIEKRGKNSYRVVVTRVDKLTGENRRFTKTVKVNGNTDAEKKKAAQGMAKEYEVEVDNELIHLTADDMYFVEFVQMFIDKFARKHYSETYLDGVIGMLNARVIPFFGNYRLREITTLLCVEFMDILSDDKNINTGKPISTSTQHKIYSITRTALNKAVQWKMIKSSPMDGVDAPKVKEKPVTIYEEDQLLEFLALLNQLPPEQFKYKTFLYTSFTIGLRKGEVCGFVWSDFDLDNQTATIARQRTVGDSKKGVVTKDVKMGADPRTLNIPSALVEVLKEYKSYQNKQKLRVGEEWPEIDWVLTGDTGQPMYPKSINKWLTRFLKRNDLPHITPHGLRHSAATLWVSNGIDILAVAHRLGQRNEKQLLKRYAHATKRADRATADMMDDILGKKSKDNVVSIVNES